MSDSESTTPRVFLVRHGETEWAKVGRFTGISEIPLTERGEKQVAGTAEILVGHGKLIDERKVAKVFISPRIRAQGTFVLLFGEQSATTLRQAGKVSDTQRLAESDYGIYEGKYDHEIRAMRREKGLDKERPWDLWRDGCEGGESPQQVTERLDNLIDDIHTIQRPNMYSEHASDIVLVAHGHILRGFVKRWLKFPMEFNLSMMLEPGGVGILSYQEHDINQPAVLVGMSFPLA